MIPVSYTHLDVYKRQVRVLLYNIIHLELQPGTAVSENELSTTLSLSRTPVREALIELNRIGPVSYTHLDVYKRQIDNFIHKSFRR